MCSRRGADELIRAGRVTVDGRIAGLGEKISVSGGFRVCLDGREITRDREPQRILLAFNKPVGIVCTEDPREQDNIIRFLDYPERITYAGRLDRNSQGLILMTNDGYLIERMMRGRNAHEKEYEVVVDREITDEDLEQMRRGVPIEIEVRRPGRRRLDASGSGKAAGIRSLRQTIVTRPCRIERTGARSFRIVLTQGLNRQIRKMCESCGYIVRKLTRVRVMNIRLGDLKPGRWRHVSEEEIRELEKLLRREPS